MKKKEDISKAASEFGRLGGKATLKKHGKKHFSQIGKKRWERSN